MKTFHYLIWFWTSCRSLLANFSKGSWWENLRILGNKLSQAAFKDPFLLDRMWNPGVWGESMDSGFVFIDSRFSDEGDLHILLKDWNAILSGNNGPAVPLNNPPKIWKIY